MRKKVANKKKFTSKEKIYKNMIKIRINKMKNKNKKQK